MTQRSVAHATFTIERTFNASPARVFAALSDEKAKSAWFGAEGSPTLKLDFRVGGKESNTGGEPGGPVYRYDALFHDIVPNERIVSTYDMHLDEKLMSTSLATYQFKPEGSGTRLVYTEQGAFLDGLDEPGIREHGMGELLGGLARFLESESVAAR